MTRHPLGAGGELLLWKWREGGREGKREGARESGEGGREEGR